MAREKHREAHKKIFTEYYRYVQTIVYNRLRSCGTAEDVEDCVSDVFAAVFIYCDNNVKYGGELKGIICGIAACLALLTGGIGVGIYLLRDNSHPHTEYSDETNIQASDITTSAVTDAVEVITQSDDEPDFHFENVDRVRLVPFMNDTAIYELPQEETEILTEVLSKVEYVKRTAPMADEWVGFYVFNSGEPYMLYFHEDGSFYLHYNDIFCTYQLPQEEFQKLTNMSFGSFYNLDVSELEMFQHEYPFIDDTIAKSV